MTKTLDAPNTATLAPPPPATAVIPAASTNTAMPAATTITVAASNALAPGQATITVQTRWGIVKDITILMAPGAFARFIAMASDAITVKFLSDLGNEILAASNLITSSQLSLVTSVNVITNATGILIRLTPPSDPEQKGNILKQSWLFSSLLGGIVMIFATYMDRILHATGQPRDQTDLVAEYYAASRWGIPFLLMQNANYQFSLATNNKTPIVIGVFVNAAITIGTAYPFINHYGVAGLGYASTIANFSTFTGYMFYLRYLANTPEFRALKLFARTTKNVFSTILDLIKLGLPIGVQIGCELVAISVTADIVGWLGNPTYAAAQQVAAQPLYIITATVFVAGQPVGMKVGDAVRTRNANGIVRTGNTGILLGMVFTFGACTLLVAMPRLIASLWVDPNDENGPAIIDAAAPVIRIHTLGLMLDAVRSISAGAVRGLCDSRMAMLVGFVSTCVVPLPLGYWWSHYLKLGFNSIFWARDLGIGIGATWMGIFWLKKAHEKVAEVLASNNAQPVALANPVAASGASANTIDAKSAPLTATSAPTNSSASGSANPLGTGAYSAARLLSGQGILGGDSSSASKGSVNTQRPLVPASGVDPSDPLLPDDSTQGPRNSNICASFTRCLKRCFGM